MRVLIIGAGPTGLTAGVELARRGIHAEIIDRRDEISTLSRAVGINPRSLEILKASGVTSKLLTQGIKFRTIQIYRDNKHLSSLSLTAAPIQHGYNFILGLPQDQTEAILRDTFISLGGVIHYGTEFVNVEQSDPQVIATTASGDELTFDYMIGADGVHSTTRQSLGIEFEGFELSETWSIADVDANDWQNTDVFTACQLQHGKVVVVVPIGTNRYRVISNTENALADLPITLTTTNIRREDQFKISVRQVKEYRKGRIFLAGDAAHCHSPVGGRGMNLGIADAADLAARLDSGDLAGYSDARFEAGKRIIAGSERLRKIMTSSNPTTRALVYAGLKITAVLPPLQRLIASRILYD